MASYASAASLTCSLSPPLFKTKIFLFNSLPLRRPRSQIVSLSVGFDDFLDLTHNKVLAAAAVSATIGQLSKFFTSAIRGDGFNLKSFVQSGGMPSTHSSSVTAAATSLGLERGFSDPIFGMSVVFAVLVMYDAQGVRREVGIHAKLLNKMLEAQEKETLCLKEEAFGDPSPKKSSVNSKENTPVLSYSEKRDSCSSQSESYLVYGSRTTSSKLGDISSSKIGSRTLKKVSNYYKPLNESVGHTEVQVLVGAVLGFIVSLAIDTIL
ncbi:uncharacterized protein LOC109845225 isoform X2 [Asparagus officinalis]|uniref:uncharacterized protein LOC109845225 isoform X1 n=1 Tax=Asparagus officinalis TaxID=4686 RepID=UPI00098E2689|nr:uncharacterized protein LOC109845225 isoform X1 [Asparagus officinalis]XP_020270037.1 uncharacterized protein LOC109845225 isoform X2 [Asparagus officinalis]